MFLVSGDTGGPKLHSSWNAAMSDIVERSSLLPRWKHPRHGRKSWSVYRVEVNGITEYAGQALSFVEQGYLEMPVKGSPFHRMRLDVGTQPASLEATS